MGSNQFYNLCPESCNCPEGIFLMKAQTTAKKKRVSFFIRLLATSKTATRTVLSKNDYVSKHITSQGFLQIDYGCYSTVYGKRNVPYVYKVSRESISLQSDGWLTYLRRIGLNAENPFFPKVYEFELFAFKDCFGYTHYYYVAKVERLVKYGKANRSQRQKFYNSVGISDYSEIRYKYIEFARSRKVHPHVKEISRIFTNMFVKARTVTPDMHHNNVMLRKVQGSNYEIVMNDPAC